MKKIDIEKSKILGFLVDDNNNLKLGIRGYFSHYSDFEPYIEGELDGFTRSQYMTIEINPNGCSSEQWYDYFIPEDKVVFKEEKPKVLRPYKNISEFPGGIGSVLTYRSKSEPSVHILTSVESIATQDNDLLYVYMDGLRFTSLHLLTDYEYLNAKGDKWLPFGVEE